MPQPPEVLLWLRLGAKVTAVEVGNIQLRILRKWMERLELYFFPN